MGVGLPVVIFSIIGFFAFKRWRRGKLGRKHRKPEFDEFEKAELPGKESEKHFGELGPDAEVLEMNGASKPVEADRRSLAAELDSGWHGYEAPTK